MIAYIALFSALEQTRCARECCAHHCPQPWSLGPHSSWGTAGRWRTGQTCPEPCGRRSCAHQRKRWSETIRKHTPWNTFSRDIGRVWGRREISKCFMPSQPLWLYQARGAGDGGVGRGSRGESMWGIQTCYVQIYTSCPDLGLLSSEVFYYTFFPLTQGFKCTYVRAHTHTHAPKKSTTNQRKDPHWQHLYT